MNGDQLSLDLQLFESFNVLGEVIWSANFFPFDLVYLNAAVEQVYGRPPEDFIENSCLWLEVIYPEDRARVEEQRIAILITGLLDTEYRIIHQDGTVRWVWERSHLIRDRQGNPLRVNGIITDITERKKSENQLSESETLFRTIFEQSGIGIAVADLDQKLTKTNPALQKMLGYSHQELAEMTYVDITHPEDLALENQFFRACQNREINEFQIETRFIRKDNQIIWGKLTVSLACDCLNRFIGIALIEDITERQRIERELKESQQKYQTLFQIFPIGISLTDEKGKVLEANGALEKILGFSLIEQVERHSPPPNKLIIRPDGTPMCPQELASFKALTEQRVVENVEMGIVKANNHITWISVNAAPIPLEGYGVAITYSDITQHKHAETKLQQQAQQERFISEITHSIRQSLDLTEILNTTVNRVRQFLQCDRVLVYRFHPDWSGTMIAESVKVGWSKVLGETVYDPCFTEEYVQLYRYGRIHAVEDIYNANLSPCHINLLAQFEVRANLVLPILQGDLLWGLLVAQQCRGPRTWFPSEVRFLQQLAAQVGIATQQSQLYEQLKEANRELLRLATLDGLTQVANRRYFDAYLKQQWRILKEEGAFLSLIMCDVDFFKLYNDHYGHQAGDDCLKQIAATMLQTASDPGSLVARYGGEEFAIILPQMNYRQAVAIAQTLRSAIRALEIPHAASPISPYVTLSLGIASIIPIGESSFNELVAEADTALYQAKNEGRDRVAGHSVLNHQT